MKKNVLLKSAGNYAAGGKVFSTMRLAVLFMLIMCIQLSASGFAQQKISLNVRDMSIRNLLKSIEKQTAYRFVYSNNTIKNDDKASLILHDVTLDEAMNSVLQGTGLTYTLKESDLVVIYPATAKDKKDIIVTGKVLDASGAPIPGVSVRVTGISVATTTDASGAYMIRVPDQATSIEFSSIGYDRQVITLAGRTNISVSLRANTQDLQEVVVTGYTTYKKEQ